MKIRTKTCWWLQRGGSPLPIPNRAVKLLSADGTIREDGRVGRRQLNITIKLIANAMGFFVFQGTWNIITLDKIETVRDQTEV